MYVSRFSFKITIQLASKICHRLKIICGFAETISKFGSGLFLLVQVVLLLDFVHRWNNKWVGYDEQFWLVSLCHTAILLASSCQKFLIHNLFRYANLCNPCYSHPCLYCRYTALLVVSLVCYIGTIAFSGLLFHFFTASGHDCGMNTFFIVITLILVFVFAVITLHPSVSFLSLILVIGSLWGVVCDLLSVFVFYLLRGDLSCSFFLIFDPIFQEHVHMK